MMTKMISGKRYYAKKKEDTDEAKVFKVFQEITTELLLQQATKATLLDFMPFMSLDLKSWRKVDECARKEG